MSQKPPPAPDPDPNHWSALVLWIGSVLLIITTILGIFSIVTKQDIIFSIISFILVIIGFLISIQQIAPRSFTQMRQTKNIGLLVFGITLLAGSLVLNLILFVRLQTPNHPIVTPTSVSNITPTPTQTVAQTATLTSQTISSGHLREFSIQTPGSLPVAIAKGSDGSFWFTEEQGNKSVHITSQGTITEYVIPTANCIPGGLTLGSDGNLWFYENKGDKIGKITPQGQITEFPVQTGSDLVGITAGPDGNLWFVGFKPNTIWRMTTSGVITGTFPIPTNGSGTETIIAGPDGNVWFVEDWANKIGRITPQGNFTEFPIPTPLVPSQQNYHDMSVGPDGNLWFTEGLADKIGKITPQGNITEFSVPPPGGSPSSPCAGPDGNVWFTDHIRRITTSGTFISAFSITSAPTGRPFALKVGSDKSIWFIEPRDNKVGEITTGL